MKTVIKSILLSSVVALAACTETKKEETFNYIDERFADIQMLRYNVEGFEDLTIQQKTFIYHLQEAALWGRAPPPSLPQVKMQEASFSFFFFSFFK